MANALLSAYLPALMWHPQLKPKPPSLQVALEEERIARLQWAVRIGSWVEPATREDGLGLPQSVDLDLPVPQTGLVVHRDVLAACVGIRDHLQDRCEGGFLLEAQGLLAGHAILLFAFCPGQRRDVILECLDLLLRLCHVGGMLACRVVFGFFRQPDVLLDIFLNYRQGFKDALGQVRLALVAAFPSLRRGRRGLPSHGLRLLHEHKVVLGVELFQDPSCLSHRHSHLLVVRVACRPLLVVSLPDLGCCVHISPSLLHEIVLLLYLCLDVINLGLQLCDVIRGLVHLTRCLRCSASAVSPVLLTFLLVVKVGYLLFLQGFHHAVNRLEDLVEGAAAVGRNL
mmetsp:Transcript_44659/g.124199  ORF Transcript_44659/g.124199 Transcript_44659/m.124199 type:complete len:341 (-) Transcript_44659:1385-2407(-)